MLVRNPSIKQPPPNCSKNAIRHTYTFYHSQYQEKELRNAIIITLPPITVIHYCYLKNKNIFIISRSIRSRDVLGNGLQSVHTKLAVSLNVVHFIHSWKASYLTRQRFFWIEQHLVAGNEQKPRRPCNKRIELFCILCYVKSQVYKTIDIMFYESKTRSIIKLLPINLHTDFFCSCIRVLRGYFGKQC